MDEEPYDIEIIQGATWRRIFYVEQPATDPDDPDVPVDITGWTFRAQIRKKADKDPYVIDLNMGEEITILDAENGEFQINIHYLVTSAFPKGNYVWDLFVLYPNDEADRMWYGDVTLVPNITEPTVN